MGFRIGSSRCENDQQLSELLEIKCVWDIATIPKRATEGAIAYYLSATCNCIALMDGKFVIQTGLAISIQMELCSNHLALKSGFEEIR